MNINEIVSDFQILGHSIKALSIENDFIYMDATDDSLKREINVSYELREPFDVEFEKDSIGGAVKLYIDTRTFNEECTASIHLELEGGFVLKGSKDDEQLRNMLAVNGCAALYSIGRGIISGITSQMAVDGTGTIMLPMINAFELRSESDDLPEA